MMPAEVYECISYCAKYSFSSSHLNIQRAVRNPPENGAVWLDTDLVTNLVPNDLTMSIKASLDYKFLRNWPLGTSRNVIIRTKTF